MTESKEREMKERLIQLFFDRGAIEVIEGNVIRTLRSKEEVRDYVKKHPEAWHGKKK